jgi:hypothetical protein
VEGSCEHGNEPLGSVAVPHSLVRCTIVSLPFVGDAGVTPLKVAITGN